MSLHPLSNGPPARASPDYPTPLRVNVDRDPLVLRTALGKAVRRLRRHQDLSQAEFAGLARLTQNQVGKVERAETDLKFHTVVSLASALDLRTSELLASAEAFAREPTLMRPKA
jgi:ribosome-binding protein aMBF1 (putative translation factor)